MQPVEAMKQRLDGTRLPLRQEGVLYRFLRSIANQEESGVTLVAAWEGACAEASKRFPPRVDQAIIRLLHRYSFPAVVEAITPDRMVAREAKQDLQFLEEIRLR
jgi:hypothetical protein